MKWNKKKPAGTEADVDDVDDYVELEGNRAEAAKENGGIDSNQWDLAIKENEGYDGVVSSKQWDQMAREESEGYVDIEQDSEALPNRDEPTIDSQTFDDTVEKPQNKHIEWSELSRKLVYIEVASVVLVILAGMNFADMDALLVYTFTVGWVSLTICLLARAAEHFRPGTLDRKLVRNGTVTLEWFVSKILVLWWLVGALIMTFVGPFVVASNGYFASWAGLIGSMIWNMSGSDVQRFSEPKARSLSVVAISSIVLAIASIEWISTLEGALALTCACISMCFVFVLWVRSCGNLNDDLLNGIAGCNAILWIVAVSVLTFKGPFLLAGNGMFACWAGAFCSVRYWRLEFGRD